MKVCISELLINNWEYAQITVRSSHRIWTLCRWNWASSVLQQI